MTYKEAKEYLLPVAANCVLPQYALALEKAIEALDMVEALEAELKDERYRHDRYVDYAVERDRMMDRMKEDAEELREDFVDFVCSGVPNVAPYCKNASGECVDKTGWCAKGSNECKGFIPKAWRGDNG